MHRRDLLTQAGFALAAGTIGSQRAWSAAVLASVPLSERPGWDAVRAQFALTDDFIHMAAMLISSHPKPVHDAINEYRRAIDANPLTYLFQNNRSLQDEARSSSGAYLGVPGSDIALTDSTTMGLALVYNGLRLSPDHEILTTEQDYYVTHEATRLAAKRTGAKVRKISLYEQIEGISEEQVSRRLRGR
jgi:isopenicillin-N epimerase